MNQKKTLFSIFIMLFIFFYSCNKKDEITIVESVKLDFHSNPDIQNIYGCIEYDSICFSDGSWGVYRLNYAPSNSLLEFYSKNNKVIATISQASECYPQILFYRYNEKCQLSSLIELDSENDEMFDICNKDSFYLEIRNKIQKFDKLFFDTIAYTQINFKYDDDGNAIGAYNITNAQKVVAPSEYKLEVSIDQCVSFWKSDISGGHYVLKVDVIPIEKELLDYTIKKYVYIELIPTIEYEYKNGQNIKTTLYPDYEEYPKMEKYYYIKNNEHIYDLKIENDMHIYRNIWDNGFLKTKEIISEYGTVLQRDTYIYLNEKNRVKILKKKIDYNTYKLKKDTSEYVELSTLEMEKDEMNLLKNSGYWEKEY